MPRLSRSLGAVINYAKCGYQPVFFVKLRGNDAGDGDGSWQLALAAGGWR
jgi:hypothetical protein